MDALRTDLCSALRSLRRTRRFSVPAVSVLALGTGIGLALLWLAEQGLQRPVGSVPAPDAPVWERGWSPAARTPDQVQAESLDSLLWVLAAATLLVLLVVCVNLGMLLLARAAARQQEIALRAVLGAGRGRLTRQLLTEVGVLSLLGGTLGFVVTGLTIGALHASWPESLPRWLSPAPSAAATALAVGMPILTAVLVGIAPVANPVRRSLHEVVAAGDRVTPGPYEGLFRRWLVTLALAVSVTLLVGAGLLLRSFPLVGGVETRELGYDPRDTLTLPIVFTAEAYPDPATRAAAQSAVLQRLRGLPGSEAASLATRSAPLGLGTEDRVRAQCGACVRGTMWLPITTGTARHHVVSPGYFAALGIALERGREFRPANDLVADPVMVISRTFANRLFLGTDPLGKAVQVGGSDGAWYTVVGVVDDVRARGLGSGSAPVPALYLSTLQHPPSALEVAVRTAGEPATHAAAVEAALLGAAPGLVLGAVCTLEDRLAAFHAPAGWFAAIVAALAAFAAVIAAVGLFGVVAFTVARRTREVGVRIALGARPWHVVRMVVGQSLRLAGVGAWLGLLAALSLARLLQVLFLGVQPLDLGVYAGVAALLLAVVLIASYLPARRAASVDPAVALRPE